MPPDDAPAAGAAPTRRELRAPETHPVDLLARDDKWQLGAGDGIVFAPPFPVWLDVPGFWDEATIYHYAFGPLFTVAVLDAGGRELPLRLVSRRWTPAELTCEFRLPGGITATEVRTVQPGGVFASEWRLSAPRPTALHLVAWTAQPASAIELPGISWKGTLSFVRTVADDTGAAIRLGVELTCIGEATSWGAELSDSTPRQPQWGLTPFPGHWGVGGLTSRPCADRADPDSVLYAAVHRAMGASATDRTQTFAMRIAPADAGLRALAGEASASESSLLPRAPGAPTARRAVATGAAPTSLGAVSRRRWSDLFDAVPALRCSDPYLQAYYWYRWYGLSLNGIAPGTGNFQHATICEGIDAAHRPAATAVPCHVRELRWTNPALCRALVRTFFAHQREDGSLPRHVYVDRIDAEDSDDADWGGALAALDAVAPDAAFAAEMYFRLARYAEWLLRARSADGSGLLDAGPAGAANRGVRRYPTLGPEVARVISRDRWRTATVEPPIKSVGATVHAYTLLRMLERFAAQSGQLAESARWGGAADRTRRAVRERMWNVDAAMFTDVDPRTAKPMDVRADRGFLPYTTDLASVDHRHGLERTLLDASQFWTAFPVPSLAADDPRFDAGGDSNGARRAAPTNGRVWPMTNSAVIDALAGTDRAGIPRFRDAAAHLLRRTVRMMFFDGDVSRPNAFEHYDPVSGAPSRFRGRDDHQHSWVNDLVIQYAAGVRPRGGGLTIDPLPLTLERLELTGVMVAGHRIDVTIDGARYEATVDGVTHRAELGVPTDLTW